MDSEVGRGSFASQLRALAETVKAGVALRRDDSGLHEAMIAAGRIVELSVDAEDDAFRQVGRKLDELLVRHQHDGTMPEKLEIEVIELACDWLQQLSVLYRESLPIPRSLIGDLVYTFDLVDHAHGAHSLADIIKLRADSPAARRRDVFADDPDIDVSTAGGLRTDPFQGDPGFGIEFDLLQRTLSIAGTGQGGVVDPFADDPLPEAVIDSAAESQPLPFDPFAEDPNMDNL